VTCGELQGAAVDAQGIDMSENHYISPGLHIGEPVKSVEAWPKDPPVLRVEHPTHHDAIMAQCVYVYNTKCMYLVSLAKTIRTN
jgi:hypothetical protein